MVFIVNADDFGKNEGRTRAILECLSKGLVSNTTIMVTESYSQKAVMLAREYGMIDRIGLHLNLTEGRPLTEEIKSNRLFCDKNGFFNGVFHRSITTRLFLPRNATKALEKELEAQLRRYIELGLTEMHIDSHHHTHTDLSVASILFPMAKKMGFKTCRLSRDTTCGIFKTAYKILFNVYVKMNFKTVDVFSDEKTVLTNPKTFDGKIVEIMTHPIRMADGTVDSSDAENMGVLENETKAEDVAKFFEALHIPYQLVSYGEL